MSTKFFCDRCGTGDLADFGKTVYMTKSPLGWSWGTSSDSTMVKKDLCNHCLALLDDFLEPIPSE